MKPKIAFLIFLCLVAVAGSFGAGGSFNNGGVQSSITDGMGATLSASNGSIIATTGTNGTVGIYGGQLQANDKPIAIVATGTSAIVSGSGLMNIGWDGIRPKLSWGGSAPVNITVPADLASYVAASGGTLTGGTLAGATAVTGTISSPVLNTGTGVQSYTVENASTGGFAWKLGATDCRQFFDPWNTTLIMTSLTRLAWSSTSTNLTASSPYDTILTRDAANTLALRNGTNAQIFKIYRTYTDASNYERMEVYANGGVGMGFRTANAGTGAARPFYIGVGNTDYWTVTTSGHLFAVTDNASDIGASGATRPRDIFTGGKIVVGSTVRLKGYTVATLPAGTQGDTAFVTDATSPTYLGALTGGGSTVTPVIYNGSAWVSY